MPVEHTGAKPHSHMVEFIVVSYIQSPGLNILNATACSPSEEFVLNMPCRQFEPKLVLSGSYASMGLLSSLSEPDPLSLQDLTPLLGNRLADSQELFGF